MYQGQSSGGMFHTQVEGDPGEEEKGTGGKEKQPLASPVEGVLNTDMPTA